MAWNKVDKNKSKWLKKRGAVKVYRGAFGEYNTRGEIAEEIHGDAGATVTRKDMENRFGTRVANKFNETSKNSANYNEVSKSTSNPSEVSKNLQIGRRYK
ncbi:hypothetical protein ES708_25782 [subsurface metagenome]